MSPPARTAGAETRAIPRSAFGDSVVALACDPSRPAPALGLRRLSVREYENTLNDLFATPSALHGIPKEVAIDLVQLPRDGTPESSFSDMDARISQRHLDTYLKIAEDVGHAVVSQDERLTALAGSCALASELELACFRRFVETFGKRVWRRPLTAEDVERLESRSRGVPAKEAYRRATTELLASPSFAFHVELGKSSSEPPASSSLTAHELASRLSYHFWRSMPDEQLFQAADAGQLETPVGYRAQVERLSSKQRARATWFRFFREWFELDHFGGFSLDRPFNNFAGSIQATPELYEDAVWEVAQLVGYYTFDRPGAYRNLLTSDRIVTRSLRLAKLYGVPAWDGHSLPLRFPEGQRSGLLTRAAVLISASHATNPFQRGAFVRRRLLCQPIEPPAQRPPEAFVLPAFDPGLSTRARYERKVLDPGCRGCHALFSPYGYALEAYDALGRFRAEERLINDVGDAHGKVGVSTAVEVPLPDAAGGVVNGPVELSRLLADSPLTSQCFARHYFRFTFRRDETEADACAINSILRSLADGGLLGAFRDIAFNPYFRARAAEDVRKETAP